jgi:hypothetical protein
MSILVWRCHKRHIDKKEGDLLAIRTRPENIRNWQTKSKWATFATALRAIQLMRGKRRLMYEHEGMWYVVSGDDLEVQPDPMGDVVVRFMPNRPPITLDMATQSIVTSSANATITFPAPELVAPSTPSVDGWDHWPDSALSGGAFSNIERFGSLADAQRGSHPCATNKSDTVTYIVGGSPIDPTYYVVHLRPENAMIIRSAAGTSVYRRKCPVLA